MICRIIADVENIIIVSTEFIISGCRIILLLISHSVQPRLGYTRRISYEAYDWLYYNVHLPFAFGLQLIPDCEVRQHSPPLKQALLFNGGA